MANNFNYTTKLGRIQVDDSQNIPATTPPTLENNTLLYGNRRALLNLTFNGTTTTSSQLITGISSTIIAQLYIGLSITGTGIPANTTILSIYGTTINISNAATATGATSLSVVEVSLPIPIPLSGFPSYDYYQVNSLGADLIASPTALLNWFASCGYQVNFGNSGTASLNNILAYSPIPTVDGSNVVLYFSGQSLNVAALANSIVTGVTSISTSNISGTLVSIQTGNYSIPVGTTFTGNITSASAVISNLSVNTGLLSIGSAISGTGIPVGAIIIGINSSSSITISANATATTTGVTLTYLTTSNITADTAITINASSYSGLQIGQNLTINYIQQSGNPDPSRTEPFIMNLWQAVSAGSAMNLLNQNATVGAPAVYFVILPDSASTNYYQPTGNAMPMGVAPSNVSVAGGITTLVIPITANYASFVPNITFGNTTITQATSGASGKVFQSSINGNNMQIQLQNVTGTFNTSNLITLTLDSTITIMAQQQSYFANNKISLRTFPCNYEIFNQNDVNNILQPLITYVTNLNLPVTANVGQGNCSLLYGNQTYTPQQALQLFPDGFNNTLLDAVFFDYTVRPGIPYQSFAQTISACALVFASNNYPYDPLNDIYFNGFVNSPFVQDWSSLTPGNALDQLINKGVNVITTNENGLNYLILGRTNKTNFNGVVDNEFYPTYVLDTQSYVRIQIYNIAQIVGVGQVRQSDTTKKKFWAALVDLQSQMAADEILVNTIITKQLIIVKNSPQNALGLNIFFPMQQAPAFLFAYAEVVNYSINVNLSLGVTDNGNNS